jgi:outer membrane protein TolC
VIDPIASAWTLYLRACPIVASCMLAGCSWAELAPPSPLIPAALTPIGVQEQVIAPVTLDVSPPDANRTALSLASAEESDEAGFVASFDTATVSDASQVFSLQQALDFGRQNNPRLMMALAAIDRARGQVDVAFSPFLPQIDYLSHAAVTSAALGPAAAGVTGIILPSATATHEYAQAELQLQWTLYDFGRTAGRYHQSQAQEQIAELQSARAEQTVRFDVASAYLLSLRAGAIRRIQEEAIRRAEAALRDTRSRRAAGVAEKDDVLRGEVQLAGAREDLDMAREAELAALAHLNNAMGRNASLPITLVGLNSEPSLGLSLVQCLELAATQRAEINIARQAAAAAQFGREATKADFLPKVYAVGSVGVVGGTNVVAGAEEGAGLHIDMPLYTGGRRHGELRTADAEIHQAYASARSILDEVTLEVTLAYLAATTARQRIELDRPAIVEARENLRLVGNRYRNGQATPTDIVDAEVALTRAQQRLVSATYEYLGALVGLDYALDNPQGSLLGPPESSDGQSIPPPGKPPLAPVPNVR